jgi:hypothetical protein
MIFQNFAISANQYIADTLYRLLAELYCDIIPPRREEAQEKKKSVTRREIYRRCGGCHMSYIS